MTIEEAERNALNAASNTDLTALQAALQARGEAISELGRTPPSEELANRLIRAIAVGNALDQKLSTLKVRLRTNAARIAAIQIGWTGNEASSRTCIDCHG